MIKRSIDLAPASFWLAASLMGCPNSELAPIGPCTVSGVSDKIVQKGNDQVDLLFMVDNSKSMAQEQANLAIQLPNLVKYLAAGQLEDASGKVTRKFPPVKSLHLGVVSSDMGINGASQLGSCKDFGGDGLLNNTANPTVAGCAGKTFADKYLSFTAGEGDPRALGSDFSCITSLGIAGCGFEQQLEAVWKALAPASDQSFSRGTRGHGDAENAGFLRAESIVAVVLVSDEEDCSCPDKSRDLFTTGVDSDGLPNNNVKCTRSPDKQHPPTRYIEGLLSLRKDTPDQVIFAAIVGIPESAESLVKDDTADFDAILKLPIMQYAEKIDTIEGVKAHLSVESCNTAQGTAYPPRRIVQVAKGFGQNGVVKSICRNDFSPALNTIIDKIADQLEGGCLQRQLIADPQTGLAPCGVIEVLGKTVNGKEATEADCREDQGRRYLERRNGRIVCVLNQLAVKKGNTACDAAAGETKPTDCLAPNPNAPDAKVNPRITDQLVGWYYDDFSTELRGDQQCNEQRIAFTQGAEQRPGTEIRFNCLQPVFSVFQNPKGVDAVNKPCAEDKTVCQKADDGEYKLFCEDQQRLTCQINCEEDADCPDGWVCDKGAKTPLCLNPTCPSS